MRADTHGCVMKLWTNETTPAQACPRLRDSLVKIARLQIFQAALPGEQNCQAKQAVT